MLILVKLTIISSRLFEMFTNITNTLYYTFQTLKSIWSSLKIQLCSLALAASLFNVVRLPRDAFLFGPVPYLLAFTASSVIVALPLALLQLALGQLTQQDAVGVWRAVPILRGKTSDYTKLTISLQS